MGVSQTKTMRNTSVYAVLRNQGENCIFSYTDFLEHR